MMDVLPELRQLRKSDRPIIVGPWLSEIGFEVLYWIPFLRRAIERARLQPERLWILSRGGCRSWYRDLTPNYLELYDCHAPADIHRMNRARIVEQATAGRAIGLRKGQRTVKQLWVSPTEQQLAQQMAKRAGLTDPLLLHPSLMYNAFRPWWLPRGRPQLGQQWQAMTRATAMKAAPVPAGLPARYVAMKFYASSSNPDLPHRRPMVQMIAKAVADQIDVVLLHTQVGYDDHGEFAVPNHPRIHRLHFDPCTNLDQQTAILAGASAFVGTYGGFAYLAPFLGVPAISVYGTHNFRRDHYRLIRSVAERFGSSFDVYDLATGLDVIRQREHQWMAHAA